MNGPELLGRTVRLPALVSGRHYRVKVDRVEAMPEINAQFVAGWLLYRADNDAYTGCARGRFITIISDTTNIEETP